MPIIRVEMLPGRSLEQKQALVEGLTETFVRTAGGNAEGLQVVITEVSADNWGTNGKLHAMNANTSTHKKDS